MLYSHRDITHQPLEFSLSGVNLSAMDEMTRVRDRLELVAV